MPIRGAEPASSMTQRDFTALMALQGMLANADYMKGSDLRRDLSVAARKAYDMADAMISLSGVEQKVKAKS